MMLELLSQIIVRLFIIQVSGFMLKVTIRQRGILAVTSLVQIVLEQ